MRTACTIAWSLTQLALMLAAQTPAKPHPQAPANQHSQTAEKQREVAVVTTDAPTTEPAGYYALVIGNNNYLNTDKLQTAINDANAVAQLLRQRYGFVTKVLLDATRTDILGSLVDYRRTLPENSNLLIYYAGPWSP